MSVIELNPKHFIFSNKTIKINHPLAKNKKALIAIVASWCGHCQHLKPIYSRVSKYFGNSFPLFTIESTKYPDLVKKLNVRGYPTVRYINRDGSIGKDYSGERSVDGFLKDICKEAKKCYNI